MGLQNFLNIKSGFYIIYYEENIKMSYKVGENICNVCVYLNLCMQRKKNLIMSSKEIK